MNTDLKFGTNNDRFKPQTYSYTFSFHIFTSSFLCLQYFGLLFLLCSLLPSNKVQASSINEKLEKPYQLAVCAIFQNETFFLREWIEYHRIVGVEHFYLYNNLSTDNYEEVLRPYIEAGIVDLFDWPIETSNQREYLNLLQLPAYNDALARVRNAAQWVAFIDLDEFLVPLRHNNLLDMLTEYEDCAGLAINWQIFGTSNIDDLPVNKLVTESFVLKAPPLYGRNQIVKLIVQPQYVESIFNPHSFHFFPGYYAVNSHKIPLKEGQMGQEVVLDTACINHYWFGSMNWLLNCKIPRREKWGIKLPMEYLDEIIKAHNEVQDESIQRFVPQLKQRMGPYLCSNTFFVTCDFMGQLGNQFFQIAAATSLALDHGASPLFPGLVTRKEFNIPINYAKIFYHLNTHQLCHPVAQVYIEPKFSYSPIPFRPNMLIRGWFQSEKYFRSHKQEIISLFSPHAEISKYLQKKYGDILRMENTVSIHYRSYNKEDPQHKVYVDCGVDYFTRAINTFPKDSVFVVFSNDIEWCKENFIKIPRNFIYIEGETHYHDLYLMSMCKHNIICNSSFSWWGAYLNTNPHKQVIAPNIWFSPSYEAEIKGAQDLVPEEWIVL
jgi:hypothetical protein